MTKPAPLVSSEPNPLVSSEVETPSAADLIGNTIEMIAAAMAAEKAGTETHLHLARARDNLAAAQSAAAA